MLFRISLDVSCNYQGEQKWPIQLLLLHNGELTIFQHYATQYLDFILLALCLMSKDNAECSSTLYTIYSHAQHLNPRVHLTVVNYIINLKTVQ